MKIEYEMSFRVWYVAGLKQWTVAPPDGIIKDGEFYCLTNIHPLYYPTQTAAWDRACKNAKKYKTQAKLFYQNRAAIRLERDYREVNKNAALQAPQCA